MKKALFSTYCTTCRARIAVLQTEAVGKILDCPKCGSMVQIVPPEGWSPPGAAWAGTLPDLQNGPPPLDKIGETYLALDAADQAAKMSLLQRLATLLKAKAVWICGAAGVGLMVLAIWAVWTNTSKPDAPSPAADASSATPVEPKSPGSVIPDEVKNPEVAAVVPDHPRAENNVPAPMQDIAPPPAEEKITVPVPPAEKPVGEQPAQTNQEIPPVRVAAAKPAKPAPPLPESSAARLVKMVVPEPLDLDQRLDVVLPDVELTNMPLARALALVASLGNVPLTIDPDALRLAGVSPRDPVSLSLRGASLERLFEAVAEKRGLGVAAVESQIEVALPAEDREKLQPVHYKVNDLCPDQKALENLAAQIRKLVAPATWQDGGGEGTVKTEKDGLSVAQCGAAHREILIFCEKLRLARGLPLRSKYPPARFVLKTPSARAEPILGRKVSANFHEPAPLVQILGELAGQADADLLIDRRALAAEGMTDAMEVSYTVADKPLGAALAELLHSLKLDFRPIDATTVQVSTSKALPACRQIEFYPVGKLLGKDRDAAELIERIKTTVAPDSWKDSGRTVAIEYDPPSKTLIVLQSPPVQAALEKYLQILLKN